MQNTLNLIIKLSIYLLVFLLPVFFLPFSFEVFEFNKQYLLFFLVSIGFLAWLTKMILVDKEIKFRRTPLDIPILIFLGIAIFSAILSVDKISSLFGFYGRFSDGLIGLLSLGILYFLLTNNVKKSGKELEEVGGISVEGVLRLFLWSIFFIIVMSLFSVFGIWSKFLPPPAIPQKTFNPVTGSLEGLAVFLGVVVVFLIGLILRKNKGILKVIFEGLLVLGSLMLLIIIDFGPAWIVLAISLGLLFWTAVWTKMFRENVYRLLLPLFLIIVAILFLFIDASNLRLPILNFQFPQFPKEVVLSQKDSWQIGLKAATENIKSGFLGSGIGTFHYAFSKFKSPEFNQTPFWYIRFDRAGSHFAEMVGCLGFLGILSYIGLVGMFLLINWLLLKEAKRKNNHPTAFVLLTTFFALLLSQFVYYQHTVLVFTFWLILGISMANWKEVFKEKNIFFKDFPEIALVLTALLIGFSLVVLVGYFYGAKFYLADINYKTQRVEKAVELNPYRSQYKIVLARNYLQKVLEEIEKPTDQQDQVVLSQSVERAIAFSKKATELSPNRVAAWETLGMIYRDIRGIATGALEWSIKSFEKALELEPVNPVFHTELGKLYSEQGNFQKAKKSFNRAKALKPDYIDALIQEVLIYEKEDNLEIAIREMEDLASKFPFNIEVMFQLGRLYFNGNRIDEAISQFKKVIDIMPNHSNALYSLGVAYQTRGEKELAIEAFEKVLRLNPGNEDVISKLKQLK